MPKNVILTPEGHEKLKLELEELTGPRRRQVADRIKDAREFGDIAENSEYDDAKDEQARIERRIIEVEEQLRSAEIIDESEVDLETVQVGNRVVVEDAAKKGSKQEYTIVGSAEANPAEKKLSNESPVGRALLGLRTGGTVEVQLPSGKKRTLKVLEIAR